MEKANTETIKHILNSVNDGICGLDVNGNITFANPAACKMIGYKAEEIIGRNQHAIVHHSHADGTQYESSDCPIYAAIKNGETTQANEEVFWRKDGSNFPVESTTTPIIKENKIIGAVVTFRDITKKKQMEELMIKSEKHAVVGELAAGIAHEIGNPLTALKGFLQLMEAGSIPKQEYLSIMKEELDRIEEISSGLLTFVKPATQKYEFVNINEIINSVINLFGTEAFKKSIRIEVNISETDNIIYCVKNQIKQVFINLIKNAIEALDGGNIYIAARRFNKEIKIEVKDNGPGIPKESLSKIGEPFYTTKEKGTGLGLMVTYFIIQNHKGSIDVESQIGEGTTFIITLPSEEV